MQLGIKFVPKSPKVPKPSQQNFLGLDLQERKILPKVDPMFQKHE
jgi:hypothetical protein